MKNVFFPDGRTPEYLWLDGRLTPWGDATLHMTAMGAAGGMSVFEGIKAYWNAEREELYIFRLREHMRRLVESMKMCRMPVECTVDALVEATVELCRANGLRGDTYIRPVAFYTGLEHSSFGDTLDSAPHVLIWTRPFRSHMLTGRTLRAGVPSWQRIADHVMPARIKSMSNYQNNRLAELEARVNGYDAAIILNTQGKVSEGPGAAVFLVRDGTAITPAVTSGILESITRNTLLRLMPEALGVPVVEREVDRTELYVADEVLFCGTAAEVTPITSVDRIPVGTGEIGPITRRVERLYHDIVRGIDPGYPEWRTVVKTGDRAPAVAD